MMTKKKNVQTLDGSIFSVWQMVESANAFYELSTLFTSKIPASIHDLDPIAQRTDLAAASATNRILALELYLKAFLVASKTPVPKDHDLVVLFNALPENFRKTIKSEFDERNKRVEAESGRPAGLELIFTSTPDLDPAELEKAESRVRTDSSLSGLLVRNRTSFVVSRYIFEVPKPNQTILFNYEHLRLALLCSIVCELLEYSVPERPTSYRRYFQFEAVRPVD
jgi:HEPN domain-containing protein